MVTLLHFLTVVTPSNTSRFFLRGRILYAHNVVRHSHAVSHVTMNESRCFSCNYEWSLLVVGCHVYPLNMYFHLWSELGLLRFVSFG